MFIDNINGQWVFVPDSYDPTPAFKRTAGLCDQLRANYLANNSTVWLRSPTERCIASMAPLAHCILGVYQWIGRPTRDFEIWNVGSSPPALNQMMKESGIKACFTQHCERAYAISFATKFPTETQYTLDSPYQIDIFQSAEDIDEAWWGMIGYFLFTSKICDDPAWPPEA